MKLRSGWVWLVEELSTDNYATLRHGIQRRTAPVQSVLTWPLAEPFTVEGE